jgi:aminomethyltransferase
LWTISKSRRDTGGFLGDHIVKKQIKEGAGKLRVGFIMKEGSSVREGAVVLNQSQDIGLVSSGGFSPTLKHPIGMAYVPPEFAKIGTELNAKYRGKIFNITVSKTPFVPTKYFK